MINNDLDKLRQLNEELSVPISSLNYLLVVVKRSIEDLSIFPAISAIEVDSQEIYINYDNNKYLKTLLFSDYTIGIILNDNKFLKYDHSLKMHHQRINNNNILSSVKISLKSQFSQYIEFPNIFKFISLDKYQLLPIILPCNIIKIDSQKKFIDLSISQFYYIQ